MEYISSLKQIAEAIVVSGKCLLAVDESIPTMGKRFAPHGVENNLENRQAYRENILSTQGLSEYISGTILFDETIRQKTQNGVPIAEFLTGKGIIPGIKVDRGLRDFPGFQACISSQTACDRISYELEFIRSKRPVSHRICVVGKRRKGDNEAANKVQC